ncbi:ABC transporter ATP-binding protein OS=Streptomyces tendae OX=1932 GN=F3L20_09295 PE=4 SV=1 [Streptomyces tendae]
MGLRSEAVRIAKPSAARPGEVALTGLVEHLEFQGHEVLVHFNTGSRPAVVPELEAPRPAPDRPGARRRRREAATVLDRLRERAGALRAGSGRTGSGRAGALATLDAPGRPNGPGGPDPAGAPSAQVPAPASADPRVPGDLIVRDHARHPTSATACRCRSSSTSPTCFVFDQHGRPDLPRPGPAARPGGVTPPARGRPDG